MANNFESNFTRQLARIFLEKFESARVLSKNVNTQLLAGRFNPASGENVDFKRPTDYRSVRTSKGDLTAETASEILTGKATGTVQDYFTVFVDYDEADEAIKMDQIDELLAPMATRIATDLEVDFAGFMLKNSGLLAGTPDTPVTTWDHVAEAGAVMASTGVPKDGMWNYSINPYTQTGLASDQRSLGAGGSAGGLVSDSVRNATIAENFAGMRVMTATTLSTMTTATTGDRVGAFSAAPDMTYVTAKDSMQQTWALTGFGTFAGVVPAGTVLKITGINKLNLSTRQPVIDGAGNNVEFTATVAVDSAAFTAGAGSVTVSGPALRETNGQYNTIDATITGSEVVTMLGTDTTLYQPNLFWHKQAFSIGSVPIKKLHATDTLATTEDGLQIRVTKWADGTKNQQKVRFDLRPAYGVMNPFFAGQGFG